MWVTIGVAWICFEIAYLWQEQVLRDFRLRESYCMFRVACGNDLEVDYK